MGRLYRQCCVGTKYLLVACEAGIDFHPHLVFQYSGTSDKLFASIAGISWRNYFVFK